MTDPSKRYHEKSAGIADMARSIDRDGGFGDPSDHFAAAVALEMEAAIHARGCRERADLWLSAASLALEADLPGLAVWVAGYGGEGAPASLDGDFNRVRQLAMARLIDPSE